MVGGRLRAIPVVYGGEEGPDLADVAALTGLSDAEVVERHAATELRVLFDGFAPGFAYLGDLPIELRVARLDTPRTRTPAGSVAIAGPMSGVYPATLPGGWRIIGRTPVTLFDPRRDPPAYLLPGDRVRFEPIGAEPMGRPRRRPRRLVTVEVLEPGPLTTVQDPFGRPGWRHVGVPVGGAADPWSARLANRLVGNREDAALLEITLGGALLATDQARWMALTGGLRAETGGIELPLHEAWQLRPGGSVRIRAGGRRPRLSGDCRRPGGRARARLRRPPICAPASAASRAERCGRATGSRSDR